MKKIILAAFAAVTLAAAPAYAGSQPRGSFDQCQGKALAIHVEGWAYDPDIPSLSIPVMVYLYTDSGCTRQYGDAHTLSAALPRPDVNQALGIAGDHGFDADITVPAGTYWVRVLGLDMTGDNFATVGSTRSATVTERRKVRLWASGPYWAEENVGADEPWDYGLYFWWGDTIGYRRENDAWVASDRSSSNFSFETGNTPTYQKSNSTLQSEGWITEYGFLAPAHDAARAHWGGSWRMPTDQELSALNENCDWTWTTTNGVSGYVVRGRGAYASASIFLPAAGRAISHGFKSSVRGGPWGFYFSSVPATATQAQALYIGACSLDDPSTFNPSHNNDVVMRDYGQTIRPVLTPTSSVVVVFNANGGSASLTSESYVPGEIYGFLPTATREGYAFAGWFTAADGGTPVTEASTVPASITVLFAHWAVQCAVTLEGQGGTGGTESVTAAYGLPMPAIAVPTRPGYVFGGYYTGADGGGTQYYTATGASARNWDRMSATTLYAHWTAIQYAVTLDGWPGTGGTESVTATFGSSMPSIAVPTRPGYVFAGYYFWNDADGSVTHYYTATGASARNWDLAHDATLYADWTGIQYAVTLDGQGGTGGTESVTATYGSPMPAIAVPRREGHIFGGYYTEANGGGTKYYLASGADGRDWDMMDAATLYAKWTPLDACGKVQLWAGGPYWAETNVGADDPWEYGLYFWWGDTVGYNYRWDKEVWVASDGSASDFSFDKGNAPTFDKYDITLQSEGWITADGILTSAHDAARAHWGGDWRMPTEDEFRDLLDNCDWTQTTTNGVNGYVVRGRGEYFAASIFLPAAGRGEGNDCCNANWRGNYLSSVRTKNTSGGAAGLGFDSHSAIHHYSYYRYHGFSVRPVQSAPTAYENWAAANGVSGAWDATDAHGIHNVFRYLFDTPTGAFTNPPLLSITFDGGQPVILTPPLANTNGYGFALLAYDALTNAVPSASWPLSPTGTNAVPGDLPARFFRLGAAEGTQSIIPK